MFDVPQIVAVNSDVMRLGGGAIDRRRAHAMTLQTP
jgi:hypothetical protein